MRSEFSNFGRVQKLAPRPLDLGVLLQRVSAPYRSIAGLEWDGLDGDGVSAPGGSPAPAAFPGTGIRVLGDEDGLRKVFSNVPAPAMGANRCDDSRLKWWTPESLPLGSSPGEPSVDAFTDEVALEFSERGGHRE